VFTFTVELRELLLSSCVMYRWTTWITGSLMFTVLTQYRESLQLIIEDYLVASDKVLKLSLPS
jgi:hypothetical protein